MALQDGEGIIHRGHTGLVLVYKRVNIKMLMCHTAVPHSTQIEEQKSNHLKMWHPLPFPNYKMKGSFLKNSLLIKGMRDAGTTVAVFETSKISRSIYSLLLLSLEPSHLDSCHSFWGTWPVFVGFIRSQVPREDIILESSTNILLLALCLSPFVYSADANWMNEWIVELGWCT